MRIAVMGLGSWGTAFSMVLADAGNDVTVWGRDEVSGVHGQRRACQPPVSSWYRHSCRA